MQAAIAAWTELLGPERVLTRPETLAQRARTTFHTNQTIPAVIFPESASEVQECLRIATRQFIPVYPVSSGKNWGYGSGLPVTNCCAVMDLSKMCRISDFDERLGYVTIEPGVTQQQLFNFLRERRSTLWMDATGSSPDCSIVGNTMERGFGHTPYGDHAGHVCNLEVVLPNGDIIETGFSSAAGVHAAPVSQTGLGPSLDGLFLQSNLGVVTRMTLWLMPAPEYFEAFFFLCGDEGSLGEIIEALRPLRMAHILRSAVHIGNDYKVLSGIQQFPWEIAGGTTPLRPEHMRTLRTKLGFGAWNGSGGLYGTRSQVKESRRLLRQALKGKVDKLQFLNDRRFQLAERFSGAYRLVTGLDLRKTLSLARPVYNLMRGVPTERPLASTYWRKRSPPPERMDPDRDGCGLRWFAPVAPADAKHANLIASKTQSILLAHGFEPALSITLLNERALVCVTSLTYDRDIEGEDQRADTCFKELVADLTTSGYMPYRLGIQTMHLTGVNSSQRTLLDALKKAVDPAGILAPGRYEPSGGRTAAPSPSGVAGSKGSELEIGRVP